MANDKINVKELDKASVLAVLYNASKPQGMGFLLSGEDSFRSQGMKFLLSIHRANAHKTSGQQSITSQIL